MYLLGAISLHIFGTKYRFQYQPICRTRSGPQATVLEQFFSRLCQSYSWLGGMNTEVAGKSNSKAYKLTSHQMVTMCKTINFSNIDENLKSAHSKLDALLSGFDSGLGSLDSREENLRKEIEETEKEATRFEEEIKEAWENDKPNRDRLIEAELAWCERLDDYEKEIAHQRKIDEALEALIEFEIQARH